MRRIIAVVIFLVIFASAYAFISLGGEPHRSPPPRPDNRPGPGSRGQDHENTGQASGDASSYSSSDNQSAESPGEVLGIPALAELAPPGESTEWAALSPPGTTDAPVWLTNAVLACTGRLQMAEAPFRMTYVFGKGDRDWFQKVRASCSARFFAKVNELGIDLQDSRDSERMLRLQMELHEEYHRLLSSVAAQRIKSNAALSRRYGSSVPLRDLEEGSQERAWLKADIAQVIPGWAYRRKDDTTGIRKEQLDSLSAVDVAEIARIWEQARVDLCSFGVEVTQPQIDSVRDRYRPVIIQVVLDAQIR